MFEIAQNKNGNLFLKLKGSLLYHIQLSGEIEHTITNDLKSRENPIIADLGFPEVKAWAEIRPESLITTQQIPFQQGQFTIQIHKNLFAVCIRSRVYGEECSRNSTVPLNSHHSSSLVFFKRDSASIRVLHAMPTMTFDFTGKNGISRPTAFVAFGQGLLCVRVRPRAVQCFGLELGDRCSECCGCDTGAFSPVSLRLILRGELPNLKLIENLDKYDSVTNLAVTRCILESRNFELCKDIIEAVKGSAAGSSLLYSAVKMRDADAVQYLLKHGLTVGSSNGINVRCVLILCMGNPEMAAIIYDHAKKEDLDRACMSYINLNIDPKQPLCEPVLHILKRKKSIIFDSGPTRSDLMKRIVARCILEEDPGKLVMHTRFLRTLILEGAPLVEGELGQIVLTAPFRLLPRAYIIDFLKVIERETNCGSIGGAR